jgi:hypothetical protein
MGPHVVRSRKGLRRLFRAPLDPHSTEPHGLEVHRDWVAPVETDPVLQYDTDANRVSSPTRILQMLPAVPGLTRRPAFSLATPVVAAKARARCSSMADALVLPAPSESSSLPTHEIVAARQGYRFPSAGMDRSSWK